MRQTHHMFALATALLIVFTGGSASAQELEGVGVKLGGSLATIHYSSDNQDTADALNDLAEDKIGFSVGVQASLGLHENLAIQPELHYVSKGSSSTITLPIIGTATTVTNFNYVQLPVLAAIRLPIAGIKPKLLVGPHFAYSLGGNSVVTIEDNEPESRDFDEDSNINPLDVGATLGAGVDLAVGEYTVNVELRYELGLTNITESERNNSNTATHRQIGLMIGFML